MRNVAAPRSGVVANELPGVRLIALVGVVGKVSCLPPAVAAFVGEHVNARGRGIVGRYRSRVFHAVDSIAALGRSKSRVGRCKSPASALRIAGRGGMITGMPADDEKSVFLEKEIREGRRLLTGGALKTKQNAFDQWEEPWTTLK